MSGYYLPKSTKSRNRNFNDDDTIISSAPINTSAINSRSSGRQRSGKIDAEDERISSQSQRRSSMHGCSMPVTVPTKSSDMWDADSGNKPQRRKSHDIFGIIGDQIETFRRHSLDSLQGELIASENDPADTATVASRLSHSSSVADYQRQSSSVADYQEVFKQMKIEDPHSSMGALHQKSLVRLAELKTKREQYEQLLIEEQRQKQLEEWQSKRYVDRFVDTITGNGSVAGGSTNGLLDLSYRSALKTSTRTAPTVPRSDQSILSNDYFLMTYTDNIPEEASTRRPILVSNRKDSIFSIGRRSSVASSKASNGSRRASVASSYTRRSSVASSKASSSRRTLRSSAQSSDAPEMNFALRSSVTGMKKPGSGDIADHLSVLSFESNHKPGDFAANEMDGLDCLTVHSKADTRSSSAVSKGGTRKPRLKKRPTNEDEAPVLDEDVANKVFTRPRKKRATIEDKPPILNQVVDVPRDRHQYRQNRRASDASELTTDSFVSHGSGSDSLIVGFVDRSEPPKGSCSRSKVQSVNDDDDEELIVGFVDRSHRSGTSNDDLRR